MRDTHVHVASSVVDVLRVATDGGARELLRVVHMLKPPGKACAVNTALFLGRCGQSLSGRGSSISFEGSIDFVPGSLEAPTGEEFAVAVPRFPLLVGADEYLF